MQIIVCGAGKVGRGIARQLSLENHDVTVVDTSLELIESMSETLDVRTHFGHASQPSVLSTAGAADADMLIAVTRSDEVNMVACQVAHSLFRIPTRIARVRSRDYLLPQWKDLYRKDHLPIDYIISPEFEVAEAILRRLHMPGAIDSVAFAEGIIRMVGVHCDAACPVLGWTLREFAESAHVLRMAVLGVIRDNVLHPPHEEMVILEGDDLYVVADRNHVQAVMSMLGHEEKEAHRIVIIGAGNIGFYVAHVLQEEGDTRVKLIELSRERAEFAAEHLSDTRVIQGSALDREILIEADIGRAETVIAVANDDKVNILSSMLAKRYGCTRTITLVNNSSYTGLVSTLGIDVVVTPRDTTVSTILQHVRRGRIRGLHTLRDSTAEVMEAEVMASAYAAGRSLAELELPPGVVFGAIARDEEVIIPTPDTVIRPQDRVVIMSLAGMIRDVERLFSVKLEYF